MKNLNHAPVPTSPSECALAIAIPLTREGFLADLAQPQEKDFVHHFRKGRGLGRADPEFCWQAYEAYEVALVKAVCSEVTRFGVTVAYEVRLNDFTRLLARFPVVTLVAHSRFVPVEPADVKDAFGLLKLLQKPGSHVHETIRAVFKLLDPQLLEDEVSARLDNVELQSRVARVIRTTAEEAEKRYWDNDPWQEQNSDVVRARLTRLEFEQAFPTCLVPARVVEFRDAIHTAPELIAAIPNAFTGLVDLTVCNSVIPAAFIRSKRNCIVAANRGRAELKTRIYLYGLQIRLLTQEAKPFIEAIKEVHLSQSIFQTKGRKLWKLFVKFCNIIRRPR
jgi:hypothetical protein